MESEKSLGPVVELKRPVQIGIVVLVLDRATHLLTSLFGIRPFRFIEWPNRADSKYFYRGQEEHMKIRQAFVQVGTLELELIQLMEGERNAYREFLAPPSAPRRTAVPPSFQA